MVDILKLRENEFWNKKFRKAVAVRDTDKNGYISRADFELIVERYKQLDSSTPKHIENLTKSVSKLCDGIGLADSNERLTYEEFQERWLAGVSSAVTASEGKVFFKDMFTNLDMNCDGVVTFNEWEAHYKVIGISLDYARASFDAMDANGDGLITLEEFVNYHTEFFYTAENKLNSAILYGPL